jgi:hypothetical protein
VAASKDQGQAGTQPVSAEPQLAPEPEASSVQQLEAAVTPPPQQQQQQQQQPPPPEERLGGTTYDLPMFRNVRDDQMVAYKGLHSGVSLHRDTLFHAAWLQNEFGGDKTIRKNTPVVLCAHAGRCNGADVEAVVVGVGKITENLKLHQATHIKVVIDVAAPLAASETLWWPDIVSPRLVAVPLQAGAILEWPVQGIFARDPVTTDSIRSLMAAWLQ